MFCFGRPYLTSELEIEVAGLFDKYSYAAKDTTIQQLLTLSECKVFNLYC